jgi:hypothetical protein
MGTLVLAFDASNNRFPRCLASNACCACFRTAGSTGAGTGALVVRVEWLRYVKLSLSSISSSSLSCRCTAVEMLRIALIVDSSEGVLSRVVSVASAHASALT